MGVSGCSPVLRRAPAARPRAWPTLPNSATPRLSGKRVSRKMGHMATARPDTSVTLGMRPPMCMATRFRATRAKQRRHPLLGHPGPLRMVGTLPQEFSLDTQALDVGRPGHHEQLQLLNLESPEGRQGDAQRVPRRPQQKTCLSLPANIEAPAGPISPAAFALPPHVCSLGSQGARMMQPHESCRARPTLRPNPWCFPPPCPDEAKLRADGTIGPGSNATWGLHKFSSRSAS